MTSDRALVAYGPGATFFAAMDTLKQLISVGRFSDETSAHSQSLDYDRLT
ncbi:MAG: hypothetical protein VB088_11265 [Sphaerochaeta sp.]|nr:hypothetical protein [Sphaerochaeta sp.]